jgi:glutamyl-tRNA reductase
MKRGAETAQQEESLGSLLKPLLQHVLHAGKRVRTETEIGQGTLSVARVAVDIAARVYSRFDRSSALIVGAGETGILVARHLRDRGIGTLVFANRTLENAQAIAAELSAQAYGLDALPRLVPAADMVIACIEGGSQPIDVQAFDTHKLAMRERPQLVIDLSVPRAVAPEVARRPNLLLYDLDDLARVVQENRRGREGSSEGSAEILVAELHKFLALRTYASFTPAIAAMRERFDLVRDEVLDSVAGARSDPKDVELAHTLARRLLDTALAHMKESAKQTRSEDALDREYQRFLENL